MIEDGSVHKGHRGRMRAKLISHGPRIFDTYELLEMLLYYAIPYRDTNPISKRLLDKFGSLEGVLSAEEDELAAVGGIGAHAAHFLKLAGQLSDPSVIFNDTVAPIFDDYARVGEYFVDYFKNEDDYSVVVMLLDGGMHHIATEKLYSVDYGSGAVSGRAFVDAAMRHGASLAIVAHNHPHGAAYPTSGDIATADLIWQSLAKVGVNLFEQYVVCGSSYMGFSRLNTRFAQTPPLKRFLESKTEKAVRVGEG